MTVTPAIRRTFPQDSRGIEHLYSEAFPNEDLIPLVQQLLALESDLLSLVATQEGDIRGHIAGTLCTIDDTPQQVALIGPLAVAPTKQRQGIGSAMMKTLLEAMEGTNVSRALVLGDPDYYSRFGFEIETDILPPYTLPEEWTAAWRSIQLTASGHSHKGTLTVPKPWQNPALWA